jgi:hypothetical protein
VVQVGVDPYVEVDGAVEIEGDAVAGMRHEHPEAAERHREDLPRQLLQQSRHPLRRLHQLVRLLPATTTISIIIIIVIVFIIIIIIIIIIMSG